MKHLVLLLIATYLTASVPNCESLAMKTLDLADLATKSENVDCSSLQKSLVLLNNLNSSCQNYSMPDLSEVLYSVNLSYCKGK